MEITAQIVEGIKYRPILKPALCEVEFKDFDMNSSKSPTILALGQNRFAVSKWVSPKRTRSYPYERVYNTFSTSKRITVIPIVKDEGIAGDRDFLQWDTISLMSLLDVYVILGFYETAEKHRSRIGKITNQKFKNDFIKAKIEEIADYHSSALHWNLKELKGISQILEKAAESYKSISRQTGVKFHNDKGLQSFAGLMSENLSDFMNGSRLKAQKAQSREFVTKQPKEFLSTQTKAKITISNYLGGMYFFTVDEISINGENISLIESKHSKSGKIPSIGDIKDGLLKMMLYTNLENVKIGGKSFSSAPILRLTAGKMISALESSAGTEEREKFFRDNKFGKRQKDFLQNLFIEAETNNFTISLGKV